MTLASFNCLYSDGIADGCNFKDIAKVGMHPLGAGYWGHKDLAGNMWEWILDGYAKTWYSEGGNKCSNCANLTDIGTRVLRGGSFENKPIDLRAANRNFRNPKERVYHYGFRCARDK